MAIEPIYGMYVHDEVTDTDGIAKFSSEELEDIRVGADGIAYANAGDAVRGQVETLKGNVDGRIFGANNGKILLKGDFGVGALYQSSGTFNPNNTYRIATKNQVSFSEPFTYTVESGWQLNVCKFSEGYLVSNTWVTTTFTPELNTLYRFAIAKKPENTSIVASVEEYLQGVYAQTEIKTQLDDSISTNNQQNSDLSYIEKSLVDGSTVPIRFMLDDFQDGGISNGAFFPNQRWRVATYNIHTADSDVYLSIDNGFRLGWSDFDNSEQYLSWHGWYTESVTIPAGTNYRMMIARVTENTSETADIVEFTNAVTIETVLNDHELPLEWENYLEGKVTEIKSALVSIGNTGEAITFVTDCHVPRNNFLTPIILRKLNKICPVNYHINGGDFLDLNSESVQNALDDLWKWKDSMHGITEYIARGNHDFNNYNGTNQGYEVSTDQFYAIMNRQIETTDNTDGKTYYCIDNESQKIRIIVLDNASWSMVTGSMMTWLVSRLTELDSSWTILIVQHYLFEGDIDTIHTNGQQVIDLINQQYSNINANFIGILAGHSHLDLNAKETVNGYNLIARDCNKGDGFGLQSLSFDYVTINTSAKTIKFTKIGRGNDLSLSYSTD